MPFEYDVKKCPGMGLDCIWEGLEFDIIIDNSILLLFSFKFQCKIFGIFI
jgi:hypothetical protein